MLHTRSQSIRHLRAIAAAMVGIVAANGVNASETSPLWRGLKPGPYEVGFQSELQFDHSRRYRTAPDRPNAFGDRKAPRPILVNRWYPAVASDASAMPHGDYLKIAAPDPQWKGFVESLANHERSVIGVEVFGKKNEQLSPRERSELERLFRTPTACRRDAKPAAGSFPLVIYHSGAQSSFEDNAVLCEYLASHGFVVFGSAFQQEFGQTLHTDNREGSAQDFAFLIAHARSNPNVDWRRIAIVGHSAGAQAAISYRATANSALDAIVSLDTTQDYHCLQSPGWEFARKAVAARETFDCPLLMAAGPTAYFQMADVLDRSRRCYLTIKGLDHNDFIAQGIAARDCRLRLAVGRDAETIQSELAAASKGYTTLCECIRDFLNFELNGDRAAKSNLERRSKGVGAPAGEPNIEWMPAGCNQPEPYADRSRPPTPRQVRPFLAHHGCDATIALLDQLRSAWPQHPTFDPSFQMNLVGDLLLEGRNDDGLALSRSFKKCGVDCVKSLCGYGALYERIGSMKGAIAYYERALILDPQNADVAAKLRKLRENTEKK